VWDVELGKVNETFETEGFVQCVGWDPSEPSLFYHGTSRNILALNDIRSKTGASPSDAPVVIRNDAMINTLYVSHDGVHVITGDSLGGLKTWDVRMRDCVQSILNEPTKKPISHIAVSRKVGGCDDEESRYMAANSYDNVIRVYDRGLDPPKTQLRFVHALKGFRNKNWPIKSSFFEGRDYSATPLRRITTVDEVALDDPINEKEKKPIDASMLLATGSADPYAYLYNIGDDSFELLQRLEGHTDRVYCVNFHPSEPLLASCSADFTIKVWGPGGKSGNKKRAL
jgi:COMPASS component SWD3